MSDSTLREAIGALINKVNAEGSAYCADELEALNHALAADDAARAAAPQAVSTGPLTDIHGALAAEPQSVEPVAWHVCSVNSDGTLSLEHAAAWEKAAHEHINDAINEHDIAEAASWVVRPVYAAPPTDAEPVARVIPNGATVRLEWASVRAAHNAKPGFLYAAAPQNIGRSRLTEAQIEFALNGNLEDPSDDESSGFYAGARWAEAFLAQPTLPTDAEWQEEAMRLREQLACVRQALPEALRDSVPSVAVATMTAGMEYDAALLRHALDALEYHRDQTRPIVLSDAAIAALRAHIATRPQVAVEPLVWIRKHPDGSYSRDTLLNDQIESARKNSGAWVPLIPAPPTKKENEA